MSNVKNLSLSHLKKQDTEKYKEKKEVLFHDGTKVDVDKVFRPSVQNDLNTELLKLFQDLIKKKDKADGGEITAVALCLIIKYFTSIEVKGAKTFNDYIEMYNIIEDNEYLQPIIQAFEPSELQKSMDSINNMISHWTKDMERVIEEVKFKQAL